MPERNYKSIGEVLGLLLEEFPNVTISKIRFLESQGLIEPERTASGYRKFSDSEVERLKYILREQLADNNYVLYTDKGYAYANPLFSMLNTVENDIIKLLSLLGLTPARSQQTTI